jgi:hypothetical protein
LITAEWTCKVCGVTIVLDDTRLSKNGKQIPIDSRTGNPHPRHISLGAMFRNRQKILFRDAFPKLCYICREYYSVVNRDCPVCYDLTELGTPSLRLNVEDKKYGEKAMVAWAKLNKKRIPLYLLLRNREPKRGKKESIRSFRKEKGWSRRSNSQKEGSEEKEKSEKISHAW